MQKYPNNNQIYFTPLQAHPKYQAEIKPLLSNLRDQKYSTQQIIEVLMTFNVKYCWRRKQINSFRTKVNNPYKALTNSYSKELPHLCKIYAATLLKIKPQPIPLVMGSKILRLDYRKQEIIYMMLLMFFSLTPKQYSDGRQHLQDKFNHVNNFMIVLSKSQFKTRCIVEYLNLGIKQLETLQKNDQIFTILRNTSKDADIESIIQNNPLKRMSKIVLEENNKSIQQFNGDIKVDFANRFIGGGCLTMGCVQEQIMFAVHPQLLVTTLLCQKMQDNEALGFIGFKRYFNNKGYGQNTTYDGFANTKYDLNQACQIREYITAIDAIKFKEGGRQQYFKRFIDREILKAYVGFSIPIQGRIVTGGWGCGVYNGDIQIKLIIQWIAASLAGKQIVICPYGKKKILEENDFIQYLRDKNVLDAYKTLLLLSEHKLKPQFAKKSLYNIALQKL